MSVAATSLLGAATEIKAPNLLADVKVLYIQYRLGSAKAEQVRQHFKSKGVFAPGIQHIDKIVQYDIRYPNGSSLEAASQLQKEVAATLGISAGTIKLIDLSKRFKVPDGQFEIWLNE